MFKLIAALGIAFLLLPAELVTENPNGISDIVATAEFDSMDTINALMSTVDDVAGFCDRNVETCATGKAMFSHAMIIASSSVSKLSSGGEVEQIATETDSIATGSIASN